MTQEIKVGSIVTLRIRVIEVLTVEHPPEPEPLRVGDFVRARGNGNTGLLKAIDGRDAWVAFSHDDHRTILLSNLERAETS